MSSTSRTRVLISSTATQARTTTDIWMLPSSVPELDQIKILAGYVSSFLNSLENSRFLSRIDLFGPFIFTCVSFEEKTNSTSTCLIRPRLLSGLQCY